MLAARTIRRSELFRVAVADLSGMLTLDRLGTYWLTVNQPGGELIQ